MKKNLKILIIVLIVLLVVLFGITLLTGNGSNKLVATKTVKNEIMGNYKEEVIFTFNDDKPSIIQTSMEFDDVESAKSMYLMYDVMYSESTNIKVGIAEKKVVITWELTIDKEINETSNDVNIKKKLKELLEENGYTVK